MYEALQNLESVHNRRKALVWVSEGYDLNPFQESRLGLRDPSSPFTQNQSNVMHTTRRGTTARRRGTSTRWSISRCSPRRSAMRISRASSARSPGRRTARTPRSTRSTLEGWSPGRDIDEQIDPQEWSAFVRKSQDGLRVLAEETGGLAVVNMNDFDKALKRIDAETSDYYVLGYYSSNPDPQKRRRQIEVKVTRRDVDVWSRTEYVAAPAPASGRCHKALTSLGRLLRSEARLLHPRRSARGGSSRPVSRTRSTASSRYVSSISAPMKSTPSRAHAAAVEPRPVKDPWPFVSARGHAASSTAPAAGTGTSPDAAGPDRAAGWFRTE